MRARGDHRVPTRQPIWRIWLSPEVYYNNLARLLVPSSWRWIGATLASRRSLLKEEESLILAKSLLGRISRALRVRDLLQVALRVPHTSDTVHEVAYHMEGVLVALSGAFDALAALSNVVYRMGLKSVGWRGASGANFIKHLGRREDTRAIGVLATSDRVKDLLELIALLRNTVHGPSLEPRTHRTSSGYKSLVEFPSTKIPELERALSRWPSRDPEDWWGIELHRLGTPTPIGGGGFVYHPKDDDPVSSILVRPGLCIERLLASSLPILNELADAIDWSRLLPAPGDGYLPFFDETIGDEEHQDRVLLLGGVG